VSKAASSFSRSKSSKTTRPFWKVTRPFLAKIPQDPVHMHGAEPERVGQMILGQRTIEPRPVPHAHELQPGPQFEQEVRHALFGRPPAEIDEMLHHHRLVPRGRPEDRGREPWRAREGVEDVGGQHLGGLDPGDGLDAVIGGAEQDAAEPEEVAGIWKSTICRSPSGRIL
jgi:hypothetical protein